MSKAPAFQLYASDFYMDTLSWDAEMVGVYFRLLMYEWVNGYVPDDIEKIARISGMMVDRNWRANVKRIWRELCTKFVTLPNGNLVNVRLERTREEQIQHRDKQRESGKIGAAKRWKSDGDPISDPIGNPNGENIALHLQSSSSIKKDIIPTFFDDFWKAYPKRNGTKVGKQKTMKLFVSLLNGDRELIIQAAKNYAASKSAKEGFAKDPERFIKDDYWKDWIEIKINNQEARIL